MPFIKSDAAHAASEWQCSGHVLVHLARVHSHTAPCFGFFKWNDRPHLTRQDMYYIQHGPVQTGVTLCHPSPLWTALFFIPFTLSHLFSSLLSRSQLWLHRGQFPFISIHVRKMNCNSIGPANPSSQVNSCCTESVFHKSGEKSANGVWSFRLCRMQINSFHKSSIGSLKVWNDLIHFVSALGKTTFYVS